MNDLFSAQVIKTEKALAKVDKLKVHIQKLSGIKKASTGVQTEQTGDVVGDYMAMV